VPVVFVIAVLAVLVGVFFAATGRGGELAYEQTDHAPLDLGPVSAPDIALLRPPTALWGYNMQVTDEALDHIARAVRDRDITIAYLQEELGNREPRDLNAPFGTVPPTPPDAFYPATDRDDSPRADADGHALADADAPPPRSLKPPGILVASPPREAPQPYDAAEPHEATEPYDVAEPHEATRPSETLPGPDDTLGPQGPFDTHDWWAEQEEAAREDERRQAEAQSAGLTPSGGPHAPEPPADASYGSAAEDNEPPDEAADQASAPAGPTGTVPNPVVSPPSETGTSPGDAGQPSTGPAKPPTPHDDGLSVAEEQSW
jgi:hypothetical protein